ELTRAGGNEVATDPRLTRLQDALASVVGVQLVGPPNVSKSGTAATFTVIPTTRPADAATAALVVQLRDETIPPGAGPGVTAFVGGNTAANVDLADKITKQLPLVILTIIGLSFLLLMVAFRSLLIPVQAAITNLLSAGAAFGVMTVCFQWGWGLSITGPDSPYGTVPIASYVPLMMIAALFGLSMDYEVFFVSHLQHVHAAGAPVTESVRRGLAASAKVIVAAAAIMMSVFGSFILSSDPIIKQFGVGLSVAVFLAGLMVILLAPALLLVFGERTFWVPAWLGKVMPHLDLEGPPPSVPAPRPPADEQDPVVDVEPPAPMRAQ
ncbi:MAG TPA: MMPL family transporter, partial [Actinomycetes bacterium]|nr:MMPL family transporter [Actinomycetes bacterium]